MKIEPSPDQQEALDKIMAWLESKDKQVLTLGGYAGTGKSTILRLLRDRAENGLKDGITVGFVSLTGKAVSVMKKKILGDGDFFLNDYIQTMHSFMYRPVLDGKGRIVDWDLKEMEDKNDNTFNHNYKAPHVDLFINDEASMTSEDLYNDLCSYGKPILAVGDHGQLPPVKSALNLMENPEIKLEKIHRQAGDNPILKWATMARMGEFIPYSALSDHVMKMDNRVARLSGIAEKIALSPSPEAVIIVPFNKSRVGINKKIRSMLDYPADRPAEGDRVICLRNDRNEGIYNGMMGTVETVDNYDKLNYKIKVREDYGRSRSLKAAKCTFNSERGADPDGVHWRDIGTRWDYAYAITCHKAQGSEFDKVVVIGEWFGDTKDRWLYTAITRAKKELYLIQ